MASPIRPLQKSDVITPKAIAEKAVATINDAITQSDWKPGKEVLIVAKKIDAHVPGVLEALRQLYDSWNLKLEVRDGRNETQYLVLS